MLPNQLLQLDVNLCKGFQVCKMQIGKQTSKQLRQSTQDKMVQPNNPNH